MDMHSAHAAERKIIHAMLLFAPHKVPDNVLAHCIASLSADDRAELRTLLTAMLPVWRFMPCAETARLYRRVMADALALANEINSTFYGQYMITMEHVHAMPDPTPKAIAAVMATTLEVLSRADDAMAA